MGKAGREREDESKRAGQAGAPNQGNRAGKAGALDKACHSMIPMAPSRK